MAGNGLLNDFKDDLHVRVTNTAEDRTMRCERTNLVRSYGYGRWRAGDGHSLIETNVRGREAMHALRGNECDGGRPSRF